MKRCVSTDVGTWTLNISETVRYTDSCNEILIETYALLNSVISLDADSAATLVHAFVTSHVDYCNAILAAAPKTTTDRLQRVLKAAV